MTNYHKFRLENAPVGGHLTVEPLFGGGWELCTWVEKCTASATDTEEATGLTLPAGCILLGVAELHNGAITLGTAVKVGVGNASDPDAYLLSSTTLTANASNKKAQATAIATATAVKLYCVDTNGAAAGTFATTSSSMNVELVFLRRKTIGTVE